jgi:1-acyl-sn-glycerol-3-phosphate acyltransferase
MFLADVFARISLCMAPGTFRKRLMKTLMMCCARVTLCCQGFHYVSVTGKPASKSEAPILVSNHTSFVETFYLTYVLLSCGISEKGNFNVPAMGSILRALDYVELDKDKADSRERAQSQMIERAKDPTQEQLLLFPEGQTANGNQLISFKDGCFRLGLPVQPIALRYRTKGKSSSICTLRGCLS